VLWELQLEPPTNTTRRVDSDPTVARSAKKSERRSRGKSTTLWWAEKWRARAETRLRAEISGFGSGPEQSWRCLSKKNNAKRENLQREPGVDNAGSSTNARRVTWIAQQKAMQFLYKMEQVLQIIIEVTIFPLSFDLEIKIVHGSLFLSKLKIENGIREMARVSSI
jgi:hypothetical protein